MMTQQERRLKDEDEEDSSHLLHARRSVGAFGSGSAPLRSRICYEYEAKHLLEREGWVVTRSAGSHGPVDLIAMNAEHVMLVQVKSSSQIASSATLSVLVEAAEALSTVPAPAGAVSRWLFLRAVPGGWLRECIDRYPHDHQALRAALATTIAAWTHSSKEARRAAIHPRRPEAARSNRQPA